MVFEVVLNGPSTEDITVVVSTSSPPAASGAIAAIPATVGPDGNVMPPAGDFLSFTERRIVIPRGQTSALIPVDIIGDETPENDEQLRIRIVDVEGNAMLNLAESQATGLILNDDRETVVVTLDPETSVRETDDPRTTVAEFTVRLDSVASEVITVGYQTVNVAGAPLATPGVDFVPVGGVTGPDGEVVFAPGEIEQTIQVVVLGDRLQEPPEDFFIELTSVSGENDASRVDPVTGVLVDPIAELDPFESRAKATILDNDAGQATVSIQSEASVLEPDAPGIVPVTLTVSLDNALDDDVVVAWSTRSNLQPGQATSDVDFVGVMAGTVTIPAGRTEASVSVAILGDNQQEGDEQFLVMLDQVIAGPGEISRTEGQGEVTIVDNDFDRPIVQITDAEVIEGDPGDDVDLVFTIQLAGPVPDRQVSVELETDRLNEEVPGLARTDGDNRDVFATRRILYFDRNVTSQEFRVRVIPDDRFEADELVFVRLFNTDGVALAPGANQAVGRILNDDFAEPTLTIGSARMLEGDSPGQNVLEFEVTLDADPEQGGVPMVTVDYSTLDVTAIGGDDYDVATGTLTFGEDVRSQTIQVPIIGDMDDERTEEFVVQLSNPVNATLHPGAFQGVGVIENDDAPDVRFQIDSVSQREGSDGTTDFVFTVTRVGQPTSNVTVDYSTQAGTALADLDFEPQSGRLTFMPGGAATQEVTVRVVADDLPEDEFKSFFVTLDNPVGATVDPAAPQGVGTILDDDLRVFREDADQELLRIAREIQDLIDQVGNNPNNRELVNLITTLSRDVLRRLNLDAGLVFITDPVDFLLTDVESRTVGYTDPTGEVTEVQKAYYSGDAAVELVVIPGADPGLYGLQLSGVGSGEYRTAATLVTSEGFAKTETSGGVLNGDFELALDLTPDVIANLQNNVFTELAEAARNGATTQQLNDLSDVQVASSEEARRALDALRAQIRDAAIVDGRPQLPGGLFAQAMNVLSDFGSDISRSLADEFRELFGDPLDDGVPQVDLDANKDDDDEPDTLDTFWRSLGRTLLGTPGNLLNLSDFFDLTGSNDEAADGEDNGDSENRGQPDAQNGNEQGNNGEQQPGESDQAAMMPERYRRLRYWPDGRFAQIDDGKASPWGQPSTAKPVIRQVSAQGGDAQTEAAVEGSQEGGADE
ncbi:MAG: Calx-beta domain-containing protein [Planctomycetota bacterium]